MSSCYLARRHFFVPEQARLEIGYPADMDVRAHVKGGHGRHAVIGPFGVVAMHVYPEVISARSKIQRKSKACHVTAAGLQTEGLRAQPLFVDMKNAEKLLIEAHDDDGKILDVAARRDLH